MTLDDAGNLYLNGKLGVTVYRADGKRLGVIEVPEKWTANVCFGGTDHRTLFITASDSLFHRHANAWHLRSEVIGVACDPHKTKKPAATMIKVGTAKGMSNVTKTDIKASNGVIHVIDAVILPE
jgi:hypothetical protein